MVKKKTLSAQFDWVQAQFKNLTKDQIIQDIIDLPILNFTIEEGHLKYYEYNYNFNYAGIRLYFQSADIGNMDFREPFEDCLLIISGQALSAYRADKIEENAPVYQLVNRINAYGLINRVDPCIDDCNQIPYFKPHELLYYCEHGKYAYGKSMEYDTYGTANTGMTLYLKPKSTDDKIRIYDKQAEQANKQGLRIKDVAPQVRTEIEFRRQKAQDFIGQYLNQDESLLDFTRGYLKNRVHFFPIMNSRLPPENGKTSWAMSQRLNWQVLHIQTA